MKILILTDSLSLPRGGLDETVYYEQTYPYLLKKQFPHIDILTVGIGGGTINDITNQLEYYKVYNPDLFILQCGIVDCAPRIFRRWESAIIRKLKLSFLFKPFTLFIRKHRGLRYTSPSRFATGCEKILNYYANSNTKIYAIGILPATPEYENILPGISQSINLYNEMLVKYFSIISTNDFNPEQDILDDHHHLRAQGHKKIFEKLSAVIESNLSPDI